MRPADLARRWLVDAAVAAPDADPQLWHDEGELLVTGWSEPHRAYHTLQHLAEMFDALDRLAGAGALTDHQGLTARLAGWYHDLAYDPRAAPGSNEHRSATLARDHLHRLGVDDTLVDDVEALVLMTTDHDVAVDFPAVAAFHDADLWILSAPPGRYDDYAAQVRVEYSHVLPGLFAAGRGTVLQTFLERDRLYRTAYAHSRWTAQALDNLRRELGVLTPAGEAWGDVVEGGRAP